MWRDFNFNKALSLLLSFLGVIIPVFIWQYDQSPKGLELSMVSVAELQPNDVGISDGIVVSVDGVSLIAPFISLVDISNIGSKPILSSDFDGDVTIATKNSARIIKARVVSTSPDSIDPKIKLVTDGLIIKPLLLNAGDSIRIMLVTDKARPIYSIRGRIVGVSNVLVKDSVADRAAKRHWMSLLSAIFLLIIYMINMMDFMFFSIRDRKFYYLFFSTAMATAFGSIALLIQCSAGEGARESFSYLWPYMTIGMVAGGIIQFFRRRGGYFGR